MVPLFDFGPCSLWRPAAAHVKTMATSGRWLPRSGAGSAALASRARKGEDAGPGLAAVGQNSMPRVNLRNDECLHGKTVALEGGGGAGGGDGHFLFARSTSGAADVDDGTSGVNTRTHEQPHYPVSAVTNVYSCAAGELSRSAANECVASVTKILLSGYLECRRPPSPSPTPSVGPSRCVWERVVCTGAGAAARSPPARAVCA